MDYAREQGLSALCTPFDLVSLEVLVRNSVSWPLKLASADFTNHALLREAISSDLPILASTGMTAEGEIIGAVRLIRALARPGQVALLHCNSAYPAPNSDLNLRYVGRLQQLSGLVVGYSGHERGILASVAAVARGARIIEKHITLDREMEGPDHRASLLPEDFATLCSALTAGIRLLGFGWAPRDVTG